MMGKIEGKITNPTPPDYRHRQELERLHALAKSKAAKSAGLPPPPLNRAARRAAASQAKKGGTRKST
jgi:hypothetical protein